MCPQWAVSISKELHTMLTSRKLCTFLCIALGIFSSIIAYGTEYGDAIWSQAAVVESFHGKPRVFVPTDIGNEPDDQMSLARFLVVFK
jgi:hypothetical protein